MSWIIFFPGFFSGDSFSAVEMAKTGNLTNSFTASWALYVRVFSLLGNSIGLLTLLGGLLLVFSITQLAYSIFAEKTAAIASFLFTLTPLIWGMGNALWHDIQMTSGMLLITAFMVKLHKSQKITRWDIGSQLVLGSILLSFRPNGLPTLLVFAFIYAVLIRKKVVLKYLLVAVLSTLLTTLVTSNLILGLSPINNYFSQEWMRNDISCFANTPEGAGFVERNIPGIGNTETWKSEAACGFLNQALIKLRRRILSLVHGLLF
jgi:energy-converting hydrogenase Eha subunit C